jgi:hypothetical protein
MLGKQTSKRLAHTYRQVRNHVAHGYATAVKAGNLLSSAVDTAHRIHGALKDSGVYSAGAQKAIDSGFSKVSQGRREVTDRHDHVKETLSRVKAAAGADFSSMMF